MFGNSSDIADNRNEIMVAVPAWHDVKVEVVGDTCSGHCPDIAADIKTIGPKMLV